MENISGKKSKKLKRGNRRSEVSVRKKEDLLMIIDTFASLAFLSYACTFSNK